MDFPVILYNIDKKVISKATISKNNCFYFYSYLKFDVKIISGTGMLYSVVENFDGNGVKTLQTLEGDNLTQNFGYTLYIPINKTSVEIEITLGGIKSNYIINLELDNIIDETNQHYNDLILNNKLPKFSELEQSIPDEFNKTELIKRLLLDFKNILKHKGTKKSIETFLEFIGFKDSNLEILEEFLNRLSNTYTINPNKLTDVKTGNYYVLYNNWNSLGFDKNNLPIRETIIENLLSFEKHLLSAITLANTYFTSDEQNIKFFGLNYSSNIAFEQSITSNMNTIFENDVFGFRKQLHIDIYDFVDSKTKNNHVVNCLQKTKNLLKSEVKILLLDIETKINQQTYFVDEEYFDDIPSPETNLNSIEKLFGNVLHIDVNTNNTYVEINILDKSDLQNVLVLEKQFIATQLNKIVVFEKTSSYLISVIVTDCYNNTEKYFYDFDVNINTQRIDIDLFTSFEVSDDIENSIENDIDSPTISSIKISGNQILPNQLVPNELSEYYNIDENTPEIIRWATENYGFILPNINGNNKLESITDKISMELSENWLHVISFKYDSNYNLKLKIYDKEINEVISIPLSELKNHDKYLDKLYVVILDIYDRNEDGTLQDYKTPYYFITTTETGIDISEETYDFVFEDLNLNSNSIYQQEIFEAKIPVNYDFKLNTIKSELVPAFEPYFSGENIVEEIITIEKGYAETLHPRWQDSNDEEVYGIDKFGLNLLPTGMRFDNGVFEDFALIGSFGTSTMQNEDNIFRKYFTYNDSEMREFTGGKNSGFMIRVIRDATPEELTLFDGTLLENSYYDNNGKQYGCVKIGTQIWTTTNLTTTRYNVPIQKKNGINEGVKYVFNTILNGLVPEGWHVATQEDFEDLPAYGTQEYNNVKNTLNFANYQAYWLGALEGGKNQLNNSLASSPIDIYESRMSVGFNGQSFFTFVYSGAKYAVNIRLVKNDMQNNQNFTDIDGNTYQTVTINNRVWMTRNYSATKYTNGNPIEIYTLGVTPIWNPGMSSDMTTAFYYINDYSVEKIQNNTLWQNNTDGAYSVFPATISKIKYGRLYNWYAATDVRGIAPVGWHVPNYIEWQTLINFTGGQIAGNNLKIDGTDDWTTSNPTNPYGFNAYAAGIKHNTGVNDFANLKQIAHFLIHDTSQEYSYYTSFQLPYNNPINPSGYPKYGGCSVRLIKDDSNYEGDIIIDGDVYNTVKIGNQVWLQQNLARKHYENGDSIGSNFVGTTGAVAAYDNNENYVYDLILNADELITEQNVIDAYGIYYNSFAINSPRKLVGNSTWRITTKEDWDLMKIYLKNTYPEINDSNIAKYLKSTRCINSAYKTYTYDKQLATNIKSIFPRLSNIDEKNPDFCYGLQIGDIFVCKLSDKYIVSQKDVIWKLYNSFTNELIYETTDYALKIRIDDNICYDISCDFIIEGKSYNIFKKSAISSFDKKIF